MIRVSVAIRLASSICPFPTALAMTEDTPAPKPIARVDLIVHDDGTITGDFYVWEKNEVGKSKKWTIGGEDFFQFLNRVQPKNVPVIASCLNVQVIAAGLPEDRQGPWVRKNQETGQITVLDRPGVSKIEAPVAQPIGSPGTVGRGAAAAESNIQDQVADQGTDAAAGGE